jgi:small redox-active disulfide protein 2
MKIEIFGSGCCSCNDLSFLVEKAVQQGNISAQIVKVTDMTEIVKRGIMRTPALAVDGRIVCTGRVPKYEEIFNWLSGGGQ